ncbi:DNA polymerase III subunit delta' [Hazenella sp. IB182357]|uniref:DNA polymerase III subunit delta n=1 Tax=Polycladospora coralii TaxID=2771432 RepID=A0A926NAM8_9BACL|nr:DNA polymerase III subunit delta' [Polycladospora coralii]MBD1371735.1 DNA polymerase III subunit delta' [Polycladospora coralii]MBS7529202.1 DNA polymerase III subunit delta' [Polycladospora coralii]
MSFKHIKSQPHVIEQFQKALAWKKIAHAYCFYGPKGSEKKRMAIELAKAINCEVQEGDACDHCTSCRQIEHGNHPDIVTIKPEGTYIKIDQLRELQRQFRFAASVGVTRVVVIEMADQMRPEAANSLLKFLEEPTSPMLAILITSHIQAMLPTILSRCQKVRFMDIPPELKKEQLITHGISDTVASIWAHLSIPVDELTQFNIDDFKETSLHVKQWGKLVISNQPEALLSIESDWMQVDKDKVHVSYVLELLLIWMRDLVQIKLNREQELAYIVYRDELKEDAFRCDMKSLLLMIENVMIARRLLTKPQFQPRAVLEQMILANQLHKISIENNWQLIAT